MRRPRVAFVAVRCGEEIVGGAEALCLQFAARVRERLDVEILTTCASDYRTWTNALEPGIATVAGVTVRRFRVDAPRDIAAFDRRSRSLAVDPARAKPADETAWQRVQGPISSDLLAYVRANEPHYDAFVFFGYLYATTSSILPHVAGKALLVPLAHDEWMLELPMWDALFAAPRAIVCVNSHERDLLRRRFPHVRIPHETIAVGVEAPDDRDAKRFRRRFGIEGPFLLYLGRVDRSKGVADLVDAVRRYRKATDDPLVLVVAGSLHMAVARDPGAIVLGRMDERSKWDALEACDVLVVPSEFESLSLVLLEAWACAKPALVTARSSVLVAQCRRSGGGVWYGSYHEFAAALEVLDPRTRRTLGERGRAYVRSAYGWPEATAAFVRAVEATLALATRV